MSKSLSYLKNYDAERLTQLWSAIKNHINLFISQVLGFAASVFGRNRGSKNDKFSNNIDQRTLTEEFYGDLYGKGYVWIGPRKKLITS